MLVYQAGAVLKATGEGCRETVPQEARGRSKGFCVFLLRDVRCGTAFKDTVPFSPTEDPLKGTEVPGLAQPLCSGLHSPWLQCSSAGQNSDLAPHGKRVTISWR